MTIKRTESENNIQQTNIQSTPPQTKTPTIVSNLITFGHKWIYQPSVDALKGLLVSTKMVVKSFGNALTPLRQMLIKKIDAARLKNNQPLNTAIIKTQTVSQNLRTSLPPSSVIPRTITNEEKAHILKEFKKDEHSLLSAPPELLRDKEFISQAIKISARALRYADESLKMDEDLALEALKEYPDDPSILYEMPKEFFENRDFVLRAVEAHPLVLAFTNDQFHNDREIMLKAVQKFGGALTYASPTLKNDRELVLIALENGGSLRDAGSSMRRDREVVTKAVLKNNWDLEHASPKLRSDKEFVLSVLGPNNNAAKFVWDDLLKDRDFLLRAIEKSPMTIEYAPPEMREDKEFLHEAVKKNPKVLFSDIELTPNVRLSEDREFLLDAIADDWRIFIYANKTFKADRSFIEAALEKNPAVIMCLRHVDEKQKDPGLREAAVNRLFKDLKNLDSLQRQQQIRLYKETIEMMPGGPLQKEFATKLVAEAEKAVAMPFFKNLSNMDFNFT